MKKKAWKDNFIKEPAETAAEPQKRPGICDNCHSGSFTLELGKGTEKGRLLRKCKKCKTILVI